MVDWFLGVLFGLEISAAWWLLNRYKDEIVAWLERITESTKEEKKALTKETPCCPCGGLNEMHGYPDCTCECH